MSKPKQPSELGGVKAAVEMLNGLDDASRKRILAEIVARDPKLAEEITKAMLVFDNLGNLPAKEMQLFLREVPQHKLALALRKCADTVKNAIFTNLSPRAAQVLREEIESMGRQKVSDVETAQAKLLQIAERLEAEGKILLKARG
jgi:flagellar motor switch protein FliG